MAEILEAPLVSQAIRELLETTKELDNKSIELYKSLQTIGMKVYENEQALNLAIKQLDTLTQQYGSNSGDAGENGQRPQGNNGQGVRQ